MQVKCNLQYKYINSFVNYSKHKIKSATVNTRLNQHNLCKRCLVIHNRNGCTCPTFYFSTIQTVLRKNSEVKSTVVHLNSKEKPYLVSHELLNPCSISAVIMCHAEEITQDETVFTSVLFLLFMEFSLQQVIHFKSEQTGLTSIWPNTYSTS